jgi:hypothetical protein
VRDGTEDRVIYFSEKEHRTMNISSITEGTSGLVSQLTALSVFGIFCDVPS